jgi:hypothetical protein
MDINNYRMENGIMAGIIDCDLYSSYRAILRFLKKTLNQDALLYLDEYYSLKFPGAIIAVNEYVEKNNNFILKMDKPVKIEFERWHLIC